MIEKRQEQIIDYVLELLPADSRLTLEKEASRDNELRQAILAERQVMHTIRQTVGTATTPNPVRLKQLMPAIPKQHGPSWQRPMTVAGAFLLMVLVLFGWRSASSLGSGLAVTPADVAVTVTQTEVPTMTATETVEVNHGFFPDSLGFVTTRVVRDTANNSAPAPRGVATPIAALSFSTP